MNHIAGAEEQIVTERLRRKLNEVNSSAQKQLSGVQDHINFTLQQAYFKCAYSCFDRSRTHDEISNCVEHCSVPVLQAQNLVEGEMAKFQERLQRALMVCQDRYESAKLQPGQSNAMNDLESCVNQSIDDNVKTLPSLAERLKTTLGMNDST
ncbi:uncharacterized protein LOC104889012 [Beta vulgaris subsp. vulgaris]|uniref:uncharacterized protein LOC104889012 n=1 Tax=Beta vulgaris subsp. vulgaris TaxID=3555 RepID=UPI0020370D3E|nr:uncharacterized protein LOC104889012 [Beta vulgaris subsp. vulgaris]